MAVKTNTTKTINKSSDALEKKIANTTANMDALLTRAGCKRTVKKVNVVIPLQPGSKDDVLFIGLNGASFYFKRNVPVSMPEPLLRIAVECGQIPRSYLEMLGLEKAGEETKEA